MTAHPSDFANPDPKAAKDVFAAASNLAAETLRLVTHLRESPNWDGPWEELEEIESRATRVVTTLFKAGHSKPRKKTFIEGTFGIGTAVKLKGKRGRITDIYLTGGVLVVAANFPIQTGDNIPASESIHLQGAESIDLLKAYTAAPCDMCGENGEVRDGDDVAFCGAECREKWRAEYQ